MSQINTPWEALASARHAGREIADAYPGDDDIAKAHRSIEAYRWFVELMRHYKRVDALRLIDPNKDGGTKQARMFGVSERHVRRVETIYARRPKQFDRLMQIAMQGTVSLETIEYLVLHPSTDLVEVVWLVIDQATSDSASAATTASKLAR